jgi:hypothetical protein
MNAQPTVYLYIAAVEVNVLNCRRQRALSRPTILPMYGVGHPERVVIAGGRRREHA